MLPNTGEAKRTAGLCIRPALQVLLDSWVWQPNEKIKIQIT